ncbi:MAG: anti-sigma factor [Pseudohongiellaceae bacterium]
MSCPKTEHLLKEYFSNELSELARRETEAHLHSCDSCNEELKSLLRVQEDLQGWRDQSVPHWDRGGELFRREHRSVSEPKLRLNLWQWIPTATSFAMMLLVVLNTSLTLGEEGLSIAFGGGSSSGELDDKLVALQVAQQAELNDFITRVENRQDSNNMQLMQVVFDQTQQTTAENLERIYAFFEEQRLRDLEDMRVGYQELMDNDYATVRSIEQLAQYVSFDGNVR